jgi:hypothetical protein
MPSSSQAGTSTTNKKKFPEPDGDFVSVVGEKHQSHADYITPNNFQILLSDIIICCIITQGRPAPFSFLLIET